MCMAAGSGRGAQSPSAVRKAGSAPGPYRRKFGVNSMRTGRRRRRCARAGLRPSAQWRPAHERARPPPRIPATLRPGVRLVAGDPRVRLRGGRRRPRRAAQGALDGPRGAVGISVRAAHALHVVPQAARIGDERAGGELQAVGEHLRRILHRNALAQGIAIDVDDEGIQAGDVGIGGDELGPIRHRRRRRNLLFHACSPCLNRCVSQSRSRNAYSDIAATSVGQRNAGPPGKRGTGTRASSSKSSRLPCSASAMIRPA